MKTNPHTSALQRIVRTCFPLMGLFLSACVTSHKDFKLADVKPEQGVAIGKVTVLYNGVEKPDCTVCFNSTNGPCQKLEQNGLVFKNLPRGKAVLRRLACKDTSLQHHNQENLVFEVGEGVTYFGDVTFHWDNKGGFKSTDLFGALGAAIAESRNDGVLKMTVSDTNQSSIVKAFEVQTQSSNVRVKKNLVKEIL